MPGAGRPVRAGDVLSEGIGLGVPRPVSARIGAQQAAAAPILDEEALRGVINAIVREHGTTYSKFIDALKKADIALDRKILSLLAQHHPETFVRVLEKVK